MKKSFSLNDLGRVTAKIKQKALQEEARIKREQDEEKARRRIAEAKIEESRKRQEEFKKRIDNSDTENTEPSFASQMKGVKKMVQDTVPRFTPLMDKEAAQKLREMAEDEKKEEDMSFFSTAGMQFVDPLDTISYRTPGLQYGVMKKLKAGEYLPETWVDLHNHTVENAYKAIRKTIVYAMRKNMRCIIIIHGKGEFSEPKALLKSYVAHWLKDMPEVLGYHTAMPFHGDKGATYVLLKKGVEAREENRERLAIRR